MHVCTATFGCEAVRGVRTRNQCAGVCVEHTLSVRTSNRSLLCETSAYVSCYCFVRFSLAASLRVGGAFILCAFAGSLFVASENIPIQF